jgi:bacillithiol synthase
MVFGIFSAHRNHLERCTVHRKQLMNSMTELRFSNLPGFPKLFIDYVECVPAALQFFACRPDMESLVAHAKLPWVRVFDCEDIFQHLQQYSSAGTALENSRRLQDPQVRIVLATQPASLLGGPLCQILKCLTAVKLSAELNRRGVPSVPACEIDSGHPAISNQFSISLLDSEGKLQKLELHSPWGIHLDLNQDLPIPQQIEELFGSLSSMILNIPGIETLELLKSVYRSGVPFSAASAGFIAKLFEDLGLVVLDINRIRSHDLLQRKFEELKVSPAQIANIISRRGRELERSGYEAAMGRIPAVVRNGESLLPLLRHSALRVAAVVAEPREAEWMGLFQPLYAKLGVTPPAVWPQASASLVNGKARKTLEKYKLNLLDALAGKEAVLGKVGLAAAADDSLSKFQSLMENLNEKMALLKILGSAHEGLQASIESSHERMLYQVGKLRDHLISASQARSKALERQVDRLIGSIAPDGMLQERGLSAVHFLFQYSPMLIRNLYERLEIFRHEHQLIFMD